jgi:transposase-like protein
MINQLVSAAGGIPPAGTLSKKQNAVLEAIMSSEHPLSEVAKHSGYTEGTIRNWLKGAHEPLNVNFDNVMDAIKQLEAVPNKNRIKWPLKINALKACLDAGLSIEETAKQMGATYYSTKCAIHRYFRAALLPINQALKDPS